MKKKYGKFKGMVNDYMKNQSGKTPLGWILTIVIFLIIAGVSLAMILGTDDIENIKNKLIEFQNRNNSVQNEEK